MSEVLDGAVAPVVPATTVAPASDSPASSDNAAPIEGNEPERTPKTYTEEEHRKAIQARVGKERRSLEKQIRAEMRAEVAERQLAESRGASQGQPQAKGKPQAKDFSDVDSYMDALTDWKLETREANKAKERQEQQPRQQAEQRERQFAQSIAQKLESGSEKHEDFEELVYADGVEWTPAMLGYIHDSTDPVELTYQLALRREELRRIAKLPPAMQPVEIYKFETKLKGAPKPTGAPAPIVPGNASSSGSKKDWKDMSTAEHVAAYRSQKKRK